MGVHVRSMSVDKIDDSISVDKIADDCLWHFPCDSSDICLKCFFPEL